MRTAIARRDEELHIPVPRFIAGHALSEYAVNKRGHRMADQPLKLGRREPAPLEWLHVCDDIGLLGANALRAQAKDQHAAIGEWAIPCFVDTWVEGRAFGWSTSDRERPGARWKFELDASVGRTRLRFSYVMGPGRSGTTRAIEMNPGKEARVLRRRLGEVQANMERTVQGIKTLAETR